MDRPISAVARRWLSWPWKIGVVLAMITILGVYFLAPRGNVISLPKEQVTVGEVILGTFEDYIPIRGLVTPAATYFVDAPEAGTVEDIAVDDGATLQAGQPIMRLTNSDLRLNILARESELVQQTSNMDSLRLQAEQIDLENSRQLAEAEWQLKKAERALVQTNELASAGFVSAENAKAAKEEAEYWREKRDLALAAQDRHRKVHAQHLMSLKQANEKLSRSLQMAKVAEENLVIRAPRSGILTSFSIQKGQFLQRGTRIAQIDDPHDFVVTAELDEFYLPRVQVGMRAVAEIYATTYDLKIAKILPQINDRRFRVELSFVKPPNRSFRRGQAVNARVVLGDAVKAALAPIGPYLQETGGNWAFVFDDGSVRAKKRPIKTGRRNEAYVEITEGLNAGEKLITSSYTTFKSNDIVVLD
jgi:HlyD family secretion protein